MSENRWNQPGVPHKGWQCVDVVDLRAEGETADTFFAIFGLFFSQFLSLFSVSAMSAHRTRSSIHAGLRASGCNRCLVGFGDRLRTQSVTNFG